MWGALLGLAAQSARHRATRTARRIGLMLMAGALALIGLGFLIAAAFLATLPPLGPIGTSLAFASGFLALALIVALVAMMRPTPRTAALEAEALAAVNNAMTSAPKAVAEGVSKAPGLALMGAFAGGLILALRLRK